jgi:transcriptional regulator with XRE-family HTH domain
LFNIDTPDRHMDTAIPEKERAAPAATLPHPVPLPVQRAIEKLGNDLALARRRRRISQQSLATRIGASVSTVKRMEKGDMRVPLHFIARSLHVFGELDRRVVRVGLGNVGTAVGELTYVKQGARENTSFAYDREWLASRDRFAISPDLELTAEHQRRRATGPLDAVFHHALADTMPDAWGRRVIARDHAKRRAAEQLPPLTEMDYLLAVDDFSRVGALRLHDGAGYLRTAADGRRKTPPLVDLQAIYEASRAVEMHVETAADLRYLQGKGTSLGGLRPKCTVIDRNGRL